MIFIYWLNAARVHLLVPLLTKPEADCSETADRRIDDSSLIQIVKVPKYITQTNSSYFNNA
jgi:hypothetical protein